MNNTFINSNYEHPKWAAKKAAFEANPHFCFLRDNWNNLKPVPRSDRVAALLLEMGEDNIRFLAYLLGKDDKTIRICIEVAGLAPELKAAIQDERLSVASAVKQSQEHGQARETANPTAHVSTVEPAPVSSPIPVASQTPEPRRHSDAEYVLAELGGNPSPHPATVTDRAEEAERKRIRNLGASALAPADHPCKKQQG